MLQLPAQGSSDERPHLRQLLERDDYNTPIRVGEHCYGCTAGQGSSCGGALEDTSATATETVIEFHPN
jgi:hypothetical protein